MKKVLLSIISLFLLALIAVPSVHAATTSTLLPTADGTYTQFTPTGGGSGHFDKVDESSCNGTTDYNRTTVVGERDSYALSLSSVPNNSLITAITLTPCASRQANGGVNPVMNLFYRLNGVNSSDLGSYTLNGTLTPVDLSSTSFSGLSTVKTGSTTLEVGAVLTSGTKGVRLSRLATVIIYTPTATPSVTTNDATNLVTLGSSSSANLNSTVNPNGLSTTVSYKYGLVNVGCASLASSTSGTLIGSGFTNVSPNTKVVSGLNPSTTYYFCAVGSNSLGTIYGNVLSFTTLP